MTRSITLSLTLSVAMLLSPLAGADTLRIPLGSQGDPQLDLPHQGQKRGDVLERFGLADEEHPPVGKPPITRWDYRDFSVYFEGDWVISSVRHHSPANTGTQ